MPATTSWKNLAALHREKQVEAVPKEWLLSDKQLEPLRDGDRLIESKVVHKSGLLSDNEIDITERFTASELLGKIHRQEITSEEVVVAFSKRASLAQQLVRCIIPLKADDD
jgi:amidase